MRKALFGLLIAIAPNVFALQVQQLAAALVKDSKTINEYSGRTPEGLSCQTSLSIQQGQLSAFAAWGDRGVGFRADLTSEVTILSHTAAETIVQIRQFDDQATAMTLTIRDSKVTSMTIEGNDPILFIPRKFRVACGQLEEFSPQN